MSSSFERTSSSRFLLHTMMLNLAKPSCKCTYLRTLLMLSIPSLCNPSQIEKVIQLAGDEPGVPIGVLTSQNRDIWAEVSSRSSYPWDTF